MGRRATPGQIQSERAYLASYGNSSVLPDAVFMQLINFGYEALAHPTEERGAHDIVQYLAGTGFELIAQSHHNGTHESGYNGWAIWHEASGTLIILTQGTEPSEFNDLQADGQLSIPQRADAEALLNLAMSKKPNAKVVAPIGHSLGGGLSHYLVGYLLKNHATQTVRGVTTNPALFTMSNLAANGLASLNLRNNLTQYILIGDPVSAATAPIDDTYLANLAGADGTIKILPRVYKEVKTVIGGLVVTHLESCMFWEVDYVHNDNIATYAIKNNLISNSVADYTLHPERAVIQPVDGTQSDLRTATLGDVIRVYRVADAHESQCFAAGTMIQMGDGNEKPIEDVQVGDVVASFEGLGPLRTNLVTKTYVSMSDSLVRLNDELVVTAAHPLLGADGVFRTAAEHLTADVKLVDASGNYREIQLVLLDGEAPVYNFTVENDHTYVAGGYRVHNTSIADIVQNLGYTGGIYSVDQSDPKSLKWTGFDADGRYIEIEAKEETGDGNTDLLSRTTWAHNDQMNVRVKGWQAQKTVAPDGTFDKSGWAQETRVDYLKNGNIVRSVSDYTFKSFEFVRDYAVDASGNKQLKSDQYLVYGRNVGEIGSVLGSAIGRALFKDPAASAVGSIFLGAVAQNLAEAIAAGAGQADGMDAAYRETFKDFDEDLKAGAISFVSSLSCRRIYGQPRFVRHCGR